MSGFCTKASLFKGLNNPVDLKLLSITEDIKSPSSLTFISCKLSDCASTCRGETAIGNGSRFPLVISTSIKL